MAGAWNINADGRRFGPFSSERMRSFVSEGRLAAHSLVAPEGSDDWHEARDEPEFRDLFPVRAEMNASVASMMMAAANAAAPATANASTSPAAAPNAPQEVTDGNRAHFAVVIDRKSQSRGNLDEAISSLGPWYQLLPNVWIISTELTVNGVRNRLLQELGKADSLFVIDASRGKAAWFNFGPEADVRIRRVWQKAS
jgi:hypothetical protein